MDSAELPHVPGDSYEEFVGDTTTEVDLDTALEAPTSSTVDVSQGGDDLLC